MNPGFFNLPVQLETVDGENIRLTKALGFCRRDGTMLVAIVGTESDGPSIPHWTGIPRTGKKWLAGILHDAAYRLKLEKRNEDGTWYPCVLEREECDLLFKEALLVNGVDDAEAEMFFLAVRAGGEGPFRQDRSLVQ